MQKYDGATIFAETNVNKRNKNYKKMPVQKKKQEEKIRKEESIQQIMLLRIRNLQCERRLPNGEFRKREERKRQPKDEALRNETNRNMYEIFIIVL